LKGACRSYFLYHVSPELFELFLFAVSDKEFACA
jgi:hypothetical protein